MDDTGTAGQYRDGVVVTRAWLVLPLLVFLGLSALFLVRLGEDPNALPTALAGQPLPSFTLPALDGGGMVATADLKGPLLINVWATWCPSCYEEHPYLLVLARRGVTLVGLNYKDDPVQARAFLAERGNPFDTVIVDADGQLGLDLGVYGAPETFVVDAQGRIRQRLAGIIDEAVFARDIAPVLAEAAP